MMSRINYSGNRFAVFCALFGVGRAISPRPVMAAVLLLISPISIAQENTSGEEHWGKWQALSGGYVARRREPARLDQDALERQLGNVQERSSALQRKKARAIAQQSDDESTASQYVRLAKLEQRIARYSEGTQANSSSNSVTRQVWNDTSNTNTLAVNVAIEDTTVVNAVWLRTLAEGLYSVSIADLATQLGKSERILRRKAGNGVLSLTNANAPVSWHYDELNDSIMFVAEHYDTFYADQNAYRFSLIKRKAQPMEVETGEPAQSFGSEEAFRQTLKFEEEPDLLYSTSTVAAEPDADYWFWDYLYGGYKDSIEIPLDVPNPALGGIAQLRVTLRGWTDLELGNEHHVYAELNGFQVGSEVIFDGFDEAILIADFDQGLLNADGNNTLVLRNSYATGTHPGEWLDQVEIDYLRQPIAVADKLWLHDVQAGVQVVSGFASDDILLIESPGDEAVLREDFSLASDGSGGWSVSFESVGSTDYLIVGRGAVAAPLLAPDYKSKLKSRQNRADYLIISPRDFSATATALAQYRRSSFGDARIVWLDDIYDQFSAGRVDPYALAVFMKTVMRKWNVSPSYVVLLGKGSLDEKDRMGYADSFLPVRLTSSPWSLAVSDTRLLGYETEAPFALGRIPITNDAEGLAFLDKLSLYESGGSASGYFEAVLVADNTDTAGDFHGNSNELADRLLNSLGFSGVSKFHHPVDSVRASMVASETWNTSYVNYDGHGSTSQVGNGTENFIKTSDAELLENTKLPVFTALTCAAGDDSIPGARSLAAALVLNPNGGAIGSVAPTGLSLNADAQILGNALVDSLFLGGNTIGNAILDARKQTRGTISDFMPAMYSVVGEPAVQIRP